MKALIVAQLSSLAVPQMPLCMCRAPCKKAIYTTLTNANIVQAVANDANMSTGASDSQPSKIRRLLAKLKDENGLTRDSERMFHAGLIPAMQRKAALEGAIQVHTCHSATLFCGIDTGDFGWGCGYRNIQILLSALNACELAPSSRTASETVPNILQLQRAIEAAWQAGFDQEGAEQLQHKLYGTRKWIGTTEVYALLSHWGLDVELIQFEGSQAGEHIVQYCERYFAVGTAPLPLYFQHNGHSRTIVGIMQQRESALLVFDPARTVKQEILGTDHRPASGGNALKAFMVKKSALRRHAYQILRVAGKLAESQLESRKVIRATIS